MNRRLSNVCNTTKADLANSNLQYAPMMTVLNMLNLLSLLLEVAPIKLFGLM